VATYTCHPSAQPAQPSENIGAPSDEWQLSSVPRLHATSKTIPMACDTRAEGSTCQACPEPPAQCVEHTKLHVDQRKNLFSPPPHSAEHEHLRIQLPALGKRMLCCTWMQLGGRLWWQRRAKTAAKTGDGLFLDSRFDSKCCGLRFHVTGERVKKSKV